jgi:sugar O-acyltransferase (sialic acid O-acetyltransferase NeuD family)
VTKRIGIFGTSGMAKEAHDIADDLGYSVIYVACDQAELAGFAGKTDVILEVDLERFKDLDYVIGVGEGSARRRIAARYAGKLKFTNLIHPDATFGRRQRAQIDSMQGVIVCAGVRFTSDISVGNFTVFNVNSTISHDSIVEDFVTVSPQACILGNVHIEAGAWIGAGAIINQGDNKAKRRIGGNTVIGSGAVVTDDCDADSVYVGIPARKIK